jgi:tetratricopeptide (TPR) repeat protein
MLAKKKRIRCGTIIFLTLALFITGCTPPGPRALLKGKKLLERGDYAAAVAQFKTATTLLPANAQAWNYLGVACQHAGQPADAAAAYQHTIMLDRDLVEAHYNLGSLWLQQNKPDAAVTEFTAYTLRRGNEPEGWLKLGSAQLHASDFVAAEKSFKIALALNPNNAEALNGLGLARVERGHPRDATQFFAAAVQSHPDYAPALLNLATVAQEDLHDNRLALENYHAYLALTPHPANWDAVNEIANSLEQSGSAAAVTPDVQSQPVAAAPPPALSEPKLQTIVHTTTPTRAQMVPRAMSSPPPRMASTVPVQVVRVAPEPVIVTTPGNVVTATGSPVASPPELPTGRPVGKYSQNGITPLPPLNSESPVDSTPALPLPAPTKPAAGSRPFQLVQAAAPTFPRYLYLSPRKPKAGDRGLASGAFTKAQEFEQDSRWTDALEWYRRASEADPGWFEAQYNYGVLAYRLRNYSTSLSAYETALAIQPDAVDARYNFALALKAAGYVPDAVNELKKVMAADPSEVRAQLALGNLYAQQLHDPAQARRHYLKVLELDPHNPQAMDIRFWLSANPA